MFTYVSLGSTLLECLLYPDFVGLTVFTRNLFLLGEEILELICAIDSPITIDFLSS
jgi:hypothetical protein